MVNLETLQDLIAADEIDTVVAAFPDLYGRLIGKRFAARFFQESVAVAGTHACRERMTCVR